MLLFLTIMLLLQVLDRMDDDADGMVNVDQVIKVIELLGIHQQVNLTPKQITQIIDMLEKEEMLEVEANIEKVLTKEIKGDLEKAETGDGGEQKRKSALEQDDPRQLPCITRSEEVVDCLEDRATDLSNSEPEEHIKKMFEQEKTAMKASNGSSTKKLCEQSGKPPMTLK